MKNLRNILIILLAFICATAFTGCKDDNQPKETVYTVTITQSADCTLTADKTEGVFGDVITVNAKLNNLDKKLVAVTYTGKTETSRASKQSETAFSFIITANVTVAAVLEDYVEQLKTDDYSRPFATFSSTNPRTISPNTGNAGLYISFNASYMTILKIDIVSANQSVIPNDAFTTENSFQSMSNIIIGTTILIDTAKISEGTTWITVSLKNDNTTAQKGTLVFKLTVA